MKKTVANDDKKILIGMPKNLHQRIVSKQYEIFKSDNKRVSVASLIRDALESVYGDKKGG